MSIGKRIKDIRIRMNVSQKDFSEAIGISQGRLSDIEKDKNNPSVDTIISLSGYSKISTDWILTGKDFNIQSKSTSDIDKLIETFSFLDGNKQKELKSFAAFLLTQKLPDILDEALNKARTQATNSAPNVIEEERRVYLPILGTAAAGTPILTEELLEGFLSVPTAKINKNSFLIRVKGESMIEANINDGDLVIINPQPTVETGEIALVKVEGQVTIKKFYKYDHEIRLKPANNSMKDIIVNDMSKLIILGKVIGVVTAEDANKNMMHEFEGPNK